FIGPCVGHCVGSSVGLTTRGNRCSTASSRCSKRPSSLSRKVSCTWRPASSRWTLTLAGASGNGVVGTVGEACGKVGWLGAVAWPFAGASDCARARAATRLARPAAMRCLHQPLGARGKSLHSHVPLTTKYAVVPLDCEATLAVPSARSSTSPASTLLTALSTRAPHWGKVFLALAAI